MVSLFVDNRQFWPVPWCSWAKHKWLSSVFTPLAFHCSEEVCSRSQRNLSMVTWCCSETVPLRIKLMKQRYAKLHSLESVTVSTVQPLLCGGAPHTHTDQYSLYYSISHRLQLGYTLVVKITDGPTGQWLVVQFAVWPFSRWKYWLLWPELIKTYIFSSIAIVVWPSAQL